MALYLLACGGNLGSITYFALVGGYSDRTDSFTVQAYVPRYAHRKVKVGLSIQGETSDL